MSVQWSEIDDEPMTLREVCAAAIGAGLFFAAVYGCCWLAVWVGHMLGRC